LHKLQLQPLKQCCGLLCTIQTRNTALAAEAAGLAGAVVSAVWCRWWLQSNRLSLS